MKMSNTEEHFSGTQLLGCNDLDTAVVVVAYTVKFFLYEHLAYKSSVFLLLQKI